MPETNQCFKFQILQLSRQETPNSVWGGKRIPHYNCDDTGEVHDDDDDDEDDDEDEDEDEDDEDEEEDNVDDDDDGGDDDERKMMMWMLSRRRKMMMLRRMTLRRKTDPKTRKHTLCDPAQSICTYTCQKSLFVEI